MATFVYSWPNTGFPMQASAAEEITEDKDRYDPYLCQVLAAFPPCEPVHGKVFGGDDDRSRA